MGDLKTPYRGRTVAKWGQYRLEGDQGSLVEGFRPCPEGVVTLILLVNVMFPLQVKVNLKM